MLFFSFFSAMSAENRQQSLLCITEFEFEMLKLVSKYT